MPDTEELIHIDRWQALKSSPGYSEAIKLFEGLYHGGEPIYFAFDRALLQFFEAQKESKHGNTSCNN